MRGYLLLLLLFTSLFAEQEELYWGCAVEGTDLKEAVTDQKRLTGLKPQFLSFYLSWPPPEERFFSFSVKELEYVWQTGAVPCLTWEPFYFLGKERRPVLAQELLKGQYDAYIQFMAEQLKSWGRPLIMRFAHEMNLQEYHWGTELAEFGPNSADLYVQMFRYLVEAFKRYGATRVKWAFCPNSDSVPAEPWNQAARYYPGSSYVDLMGMDGYNWEEGEKGRTFEKIFLSLYGEIKALVSDKPLVIFETASVGSQKEKNRWLQEATKVCKQWRIETLIWFNVQKERDWRIVLEEKTKEGFTEKSQTRL